MPKYLEKIVGEVEIQGIIEIDKTSQGILKIYLFENYWYLLEILETIYVCANKLLSVFDKKYLKPYNFVQ